MVNFTGPGIFWTTLLSTVSILTLITLVGRLFGGLFPSRLRGLARFYLSPVLGLATVTIFASLAGRVLPLGNSVIVPVMTVYLLVWSLVREPSIASALRHSFSISIFGLVCGASILGPLFVFGAFNSNNDAFTYLAHANWLQENAFGDPILPEDVTPLTTQIALYQQAGFRMGGSFLLALVQSLLNLRWSYEIFPAVVISSVAACCISIGFPLARSLRFLRRYLRFALLALPAFTLGGIVFGANFGFLPQTIGLALGAGGLFTFGPLLRWALEDKILVSAITKSAVPLAILFSAAMFSYSELAPFLVLATLASVGVASVRFRAWRSVFLLLGVVASLSVFLLNTELIRSYSALRTQSGVVVGAPVDWTLFGYFSHLVGMHGGAWDGFQWSLPENSGSISLAVGLALTAVVGLLLLREARVIWSTFCSGVLLPAGMALLIFLVAIFYFRYFVASPFPKGLGQSWSQFKLSDWAHPFAAAFVLLSVVNKFRKTEKYLKIVLLALFFGGLICTIFVGIARTEPFSKYYGGVHDLNRFYREFRSTVRSTCPIGARIYLALNDQHHKFRQMAVYYLPDYDVISDWMDDSYIFSQLPIERRTQLLNVGDCVVEPFADKVLLNSGAIIGPFRIGLFDGRGKIRIVSAAGALDRESDGQNWWYWVEHKVDFLLQPLFVPKEAIQTRIVFEYRTRDKQVLTVLIRTRSGLSKKFSIYSPGKVSAIFDETVELLPSDLEVISIEGDGIASPLGRGDPRVAAWIIRNLTVVPETNRSSNMRRAN